MSLSQLESIITKNILKAHVKAQKENTKKGRLENKGIKVVKKVIRDGKRIPISDSQDNSIINTLQMIKNMDLLALIYSDPENTDSFSAGYISCIFSDDIIINHITSYGRYDGFVVKRIEDIYRIETKSKYCTKLSKLAKQYNNLYDSISIHNDSGILSLLWFALKKEKYVSIGLCDNDLVDFSGKVISVDSKTVKVQSYDEYGDSDGENVFSIEDITFVSCDGEDENMLMILSNN